jgi:hypothetical protein
VPYELVEEIVPVFEVMVETAARDSEAIGKSIDLQSGNAFIDQRSLSGINPVLHGVFRSSPDHLFLPQRKGAIRTPPFVHLIISGKYHH